MKNLLLTGAIIACLSLCACSSDEIEEPTNKNITSTELLQQEGFLKTADSLNEADNGDVTNPRPRN